MSAALIIGAQLLALVVVLPLLAAAKRGDRP